MASARLPSLIRQHRRRIGLSQKELAKRLGYDHSRISRFESGADNPPRAFIEHFIRALELHDAQAEELWDAYRSRERSPSEFARHSHLPRYAYHRLPELELRLEELSVLLSDPNGLPIICISGPSGVGKTTFALELANRVLARGVFDNVYWLSARQDYRANTPLNADALNLEGVLEQLLAQMGLAEVERRGVTEKLSAIQNRLTRRRSLIVLDNMEESADEFGIVRALVNVVGKSRLLITTHNRALDEFPLVHSYHLDGLSEADTLAFIREEAGRVGLASLGQTRADLLHRVYQLTGGAPLALRRVIGHTRTWSLETALQHLRHATDQSDRELYSRLFRADWNALEPAARRLWIYLGRMIPTSISQQQLRVGFGQDFDHALEILNQRCLLDSNFSLDEANKRISLHPLARFFVENAADYVTLDPALAAFHQRGCIVHAATSWLALLDTSPSLVSREDERANILFCIRESSTQQFHDLVLKFWDQISTRLFNSGYWHEYTQLDQHALAAAQATGQRHSEAEIFSELSWVALERGEYGRAQTLAQSALAIFDELQDLFWLAIVRRYLATIPLARGDYERARIELQSALNFIREIRPRAEREVQERLELQAGVLHESLGIALRELGDYAAAEKELLLGVESSQKRGALAQSISQLNIGILRLEQNNFAEAETRLRACLELARTENFREIMAGALYNLGRVALKCGDKITARDSVEHARDLYHEIGVLAQENKAVELLNTLGDSPRTVG